MLITFDFSSTRQGCDQRARTRREESGGERNTYLPCGELQPTRHCGVGSGWTGEEGNYNTHFSQHIILHSDK